MSDPVDLWIAHVIERLESFLEDPSATEKAKRAIAALEAIVKETS